MPERFEGFPSEALDFFKGLEAHNNREWFQANKEVYERACREPMKQLMAELEPRLGRSKITRINRDMRFHRDRSPYKTHLSAGVGRYYVSLSKFGLYVGTGVYKPDSAKLERLRSAIDSNPSGRKLDAMVKALRRKGYDVDTHEKVPSAPRGYSADHPRIDLLRMKDIFAGKVLAPGPWLSSRKAFDRITSVMTDIKPFRDWLQHHVG